MGFVPPRPPKPESDRPTAAILASGTGTNALNLIANVPNKAPFPVMACLISDNPDAPVLDKASRLGVDAVALPYARAPGTALTEAKTAHEAALLSRLRALEVSWLFLAGYRRILSPGFLRDFHAAAGAPKRIINIHPSLLPAFPGKDGYGDAYAAGVTRHGATVHFVDEGIDTGPIILQRAYEVEPGTAFDRFKALGLALEHRLYLDAVTYLFTEKRAP